MGIYPTFDYYRVFKTSAGKWAEPAGTRKKVYPNTKKAFIKHVLLNELETDYYQLISDEQECGMQQLRQFYGLEEKELKTEPSTK